MTYHNNTNNSHEWEQQLYHHQQEQITSFPNGGKQESDASGRGSGGGGGGSPIPKPIRRRSRASKRTPTTLLNANTSNFRALVQQFTGCPSPSVATLSCGGTAGNGKGKGPVNLNFGQGSVQNYSATNLMFTNCNHPQQQNAHYHQQYDQMQERVQQQVDDQEVMASSALNHNNDHDRNFGISSEEPLLIDHLSMNDLIATEFFSIQNIFN